MLKPVIKLLRPHQYIKNGFVFVGPLFAHRWALEDLQQALLVFVAFCAAASAVYVLNDIFDLEADREHPQKRYRPLASGALSIATGWKIAVGLALCAMSLAGLVSLWAMGMVVAYLAINIGYSMSWKHIVVVDVFVISTGFMLRILAGTHGLGIQPSPWLLICGVMITLFLGFAKRRAELKTLEESQMNDPKLIRRVLDDYTPAMIEQFMAISAACTILTYSLYTVSAETVARHGTESLIYTVPFVVYGVFRYLYLLHRHGEGDDTAMTLYTDSHLLLTVVAWAAVAVLAIA